MKISSSAGQIRKDKTALLSSSRSYIHYKSLRKSSDASDDESETEEVNKQGNVPLKRIRPRLKAGDSDKTRGREEDRLNSSNTVLLTKEILPNDTLRSFSLCYGCSINDLKRANGLISDQDFYALTTIKVPVNRYSLLTVSDENDQSLINKNLSSLEELPVSNPGPSRIHDSINSNEFATATLSPHSSNSHRSLSSPSLQTSLLCNNENTQMHEETALLPSSETESENFRLEALEENNTGIYLKKLDKDICKTVKKADLRPEQPMYNESLNEVVSSISSVQYHPLDSPIMQGHLALHRRTKTNGADCGMKWWCVVSCFFLILLVVVILALVEYYKSE